jgi:hypothetical protein
MTLLKPRLAYANLGGGCECRVVLRAARARGSEAAPGVVLPGDIGLWIVSPQS